MQSDIKVANKTFWEISAVQEQTIRQIASSGTSAARKTEAVLSIVFNEPLFDSIHKIQPNSVAKSANISNIEVIENNNYLENPKYIKLYPNPSSGTITVDYLLPDKQDGKLVINDIAGKEVAFFSLPSSNNTLILNIKTFSEGVYFYNVRIGDLVVSTDKLVIIK